MNSAEVGVAIRGLSYIGISSSRLEEWEEYACNLLGMSRAESDDSDTLLLRMDDRGFRIAVHRNDLEGLAYMGFEVAHAAAFEAAKASLEAAGITTREVPPDSRRARQTTDLFRTEDPAGNVIEIGYGQRADAAPFVSPRGVRFVSDSRVGMGHVVLLVADYEANVDFYTRVLGFRFSDLMTLGESPMAFLHCNERHHSVAIVGAGADVGLHHLMVEVQTLDDVGRAYDEALERRVAIEMSLGRHSNDQVISFYGCTPSGFSVEYGWGGLRVDDETWIVTELDRPSIWGHAPASR
ncbi:MAG: VOC family protein [Actinomycetota bacterium]